MRRRMTAAITFSMIPMVQAPIAANAAAGQSITIPVLVATSHYANATDKLSDMIFFKAIKSKLITPNVDAPYAMIIELLSPKSSARKDRVDVVYTWHKRVLGKATFACAAAQVASCSTAIVKEAERVSRTVRLPS